jgi:hypothetical protein
MNLSISTGNGRTLPDGMIVRSRGFGQEDGPRVTSHEGF